MTKRKTKIPQPLQRSRENTIQSHAFYTPFDALGQHLVRVSNDGRSNSVPASPAPAGEAPEDAEKLFSEAMSDVVPLSDKGQERVPPTARAKNPPRFLQQEESEVQAYLMDLVTGDAPFELIYSDEYVDGAVVGLSPEILKKLRSGDFSYQDYIDLHGYTKTEARAVVIDFVRQSFASGLRCVLIVSGRGLNSKDKQPVLKEGLVSWLTRAPLKRMVLAFASARSYDGGAGAFYVLLRRIKGKAPLLTPAV